METPNGIDPTLSSPDHKDVAKISQEIVDARTAWFFKGICATGTKYPDGTTNKSPGADVTGGGSDVATYYYETIHYAESVPLLFYASAILNRAYPDGRNSAVDDPKTVVMAQVPSKVEGEDEIVITGKSATLDDRGLMTPFVLTQRVNHDLASQLFEALKENPNSFDQFLKTTFPGIDSSSDDYDGLYRLMANKLILLDGEKIQAFANKYPAVTDTSRPGKFEDPFIRQHEAKNFLDQSEVRILSNPTGSGTVEDFDPIKIRIRATFRKPPSYISEDTLSIGPKIVEDKVSIGNKIRSFFKR